MNYEYDYIDSEDRRSRAVAWAMSRPCRPRGGTACIVGARHGGCAGRAGSPRAVAPRAADWTTLGQPTTLYGVQFMLIVIDRRRHGRAVDVYIYRCYATRTVLFEIGIYIDLFIHYVSAPPPPAPPSKQVYTAEHVIRILRVKEPGASSCSRRSIASGGARARRRRSSPRAAPPLLL